MSRLSFIIFNLILFLKNSEAQQKESSVVKETNLVDKKSEYSVKNSREINYEKRSEIADRYRKSPQMEALDAQIEAYKTKALKNVLVFGGFAKRWLYENDFNKMVDDITKPRDLRNEFLKMVENGDVKISYKTVGIEWPIKIEIIENHSK